MHMPISASKKEHLFFKNKIIKGCFFIINVVHTKTLVFFPSGWNWLYTLYIVCVCIYVVIWLYIYIYIYYIFSYMYIHIYANLPVNVIVRLPHPRSGDSQGQETFLAPSPDKQTRNYDTECSNHHLPLSILRSKGLTCSKMKSCAVYTNLPVNYIYYIYNTYI